MRADDSFAHEPDVATAGTGPTGLPRCPERDPRCAIQAGQCVGREGHPGKHFEGCGYSWSSPADSDDPPPPRARHKRRDDDRGMDPGLFC